MTSHLPAIRGIFDLRYQDLAVDDYSCGLDALDLTNAKMRMGDALYWATPIERLSPIEIERPEDIGLDRNLHFNPI